jgi:hypothetical protein
VPQAEPTATGRERERRNSGEQHRNETQPRAILSVAVRLRDRRTRNSRDQTAIARGLNDRTLPGEAVQATRIGERQLPDKRKPDAQRNHQRRS